MFSAKTLKLSHPPSFKGFKGSGYPEAQGSQLRCGLQCPLWGPPPLPSCPGWSPLCFTNPALPCDADRPKERFVWRRGEGAAGPAPPTFHTPPLHCPQPLPHPTSIRGWHLVPTSLTQPASSLPLGVSSPLRALATPLLVTSPVSTAPAAGSCHPLTRRSVLYFRISLAS